ncbi:hypothetical protein CBER1_01349 [Cercospora berteroae]|uniref:AMP-dependent synthetase/ligase domain-containing protein n=1 Tax=Cercospora berteroae TaxID=357750 RepID=A0A2S6CCB3_9PEZI|nr:hypothetical protein CBER1_01349 [Cercospora berteroae]
MAPELSVLNGPTDQPLWTITLGSLIDVQAQAHGDRTALIVPWQNVRRSYNDLATRSRIIAKALLQSGLQYGDCIGIMAGNCSEYIEVFLGAARIGVTSVVLNSNYTPTELCNAMSFSEIKLLFIARFPGPKLNFTTDIERLTESYKGAQIVVFDDEEHTNRKDLTLEHFKTFYAKGQSSNISDAELTHKQALVRPADTLNLQFTSGTTGAPKAAMLSHVNLINNANLLGDRIGLTETDIICCPPPLFHCFGLVMGFLYAFTRGSSIVYPSQQFDAVLVLQAIETERCTFLHGVPTMFTAQLDQNIKRHYDLKSLRVALAAGSQVPQKLLDTVEQRLSTVGTLLPHTGVKVADVEGRIVPRGVEGEICTSGYALQKGYLKDIRKTDEVMVTDLSGTRWMHAGDQGVLDKDGYLRITGRIKDLIIRGGENIIPAEIEERLLAHPSIVEAAVVGVPHERYGAAVACFLRQAEHTLRPTGAELAAWVRETLGRHKTPEHVWWVGDIGVDEDFPKTASGKHQKHVLRKIGTEILKASSPLRPRL